MKTLYYIKKIYIYIKVYIVRASLNSRLYISLSVIPVVEITAALEYAPLLNRRRTFNREKEISAAALNRSFTIVRR